MNLKLVLLGALSGLLTAMKVDYDAFRKWKSLDEALHYRWDLAAFRWLQGVVIGSGIFGAFTGATS